ncbi:MAG TPA: hypothetical protein VIH52_00790 [Candidatus Nanoarchaeia archaeon]
MTIEELKNLIKQSYLYVLAVVAVLTVALLVYIYLDNPRGEQGFGNLPAPKVESKLSDKVKITSSGNFSGSFPKVINVYKKAQALDAKDLAKKLEFTGEPKVENDTFYWEGLAKSLTVTKITFNFLVNSTIGAKTLNEEEAFTKATATLKSLDLAGGDIVLEKIGTAYLLVNPYHVEEVLVSNANVYSIQMGAKLDSVKVVNSLGSGTLYTVDIGVDGSVRKIQGSLEKLSFTEKSTYPIKHLSTVKKEIKEEKLKVVDLSNKIVPNQQLRVTYNKAELVYYLSTGSTEYLQPIFLLTSAEPFRGNMMTGVLEALKDEVYR